MTKKGIRYVTVLLFCGLIFGTLPVWAGDLTINAGSTFFLNDSDLYMNGNNVIVKSGATLNLGSGHVYNLGKLIVADGGNVIYGTATIEFSNPNPAPNPAPGPDNANTGLNNGGGGGCFVGAVILQ